MNDSSNNINIEETKNNIKENKKGKFSFVKLLIILVILIAVILFGARLYFRIPVHDYYKNSEKAFKIPGLSLGLVPQGLCYSEENDLFLVTGYMKDGSAGAIYEISSSGEYLKGVRLKDKDGNDDNCHAGGIEIYKDYVYIANNNCLNVYSYSDIKNANENDYIQSIGSFNTSSENDKINIACMTINDEKIILAEFFREENYPTNETHRFTTTGGDYNTAMAAVFDLSEDEEFGIVSEPVAAISLPGLVQGITYHNDKIYISTSYATAFSHIYAYDEAKSNHNKTVTLLDKEVPLIELDSSSLVSDMKIAPMSEEIVFYNDMFYTMCESASLKYFFGNLTGAGYCYRTHIY